jgi:hypothetical protein
MLGYGSVMRTLLAVSLLALTAGAGCSRIAGRRAQYSLPAGIQRP